uniref:Uncharacterized protein n=1 Tax=Panagrolaimus superbus TaxID=310955 RepID=A0A914Y404_9BILA
MLNLYIPFSGDASLHRMQKRQIYESFGGYPRQTVTSYGNQHSSISSTSGGTVIGSGIGGSQLIGNGFGGGVIGSGLGGGIVGTPIQHVSNIGEPLVTTYGNGGGLIGNPYGASVISPYGGNVVKKTVVTETFVNQGYQG